MRGQEWHFQPEVKRSFFPNVSASYRGDWSVIERDGVLNPALGDNTTASADISSGSGDEEDVAEDERIWPIIGPLLRQADSGSLSFSLLSNTTLRGDRRIVGVEGVLRWRTHYHSSHAARLYGVHLVQHGLVYLVGREERTVSFPLLSWLPMLAHDAGDSEQPTSAAIRAMLPELADAWKVKGQDRYDQADLLEEEELGGGRRNRSATARRPTPTTPQAAFNESVALVKGTRTFWDMASNWLELCADHCSFRIDWHGALASSSCSYLAVLRLRPIPADISYAQVELLERGTKSAAPFWTAR